MGIYPFAVVVLCGTYTFGGWVSGRMETRPEKQHSEQMGIPSVTANFPTLFFTIFVLHFALHCTTKSPPFFGYFGNAISYYQNNSDPPDYRVLQWFLHSSIGQTRYFKYSKKKNILNFFFFSGTLFANFGTFVANFPRVFNQKIRNFCRENHTHENLILLYLTQSRNSNDRNSSRYD